MSKAAKKPKTPRKPAPPAPDLSRGARQLAAEAAAAVHADKCRRR